MRVVRTIPTSPTAPLFTSSRARAYSGKNLTTWPTIIFTPAFSTASSTSSPCSTVRASGFSHKMCLPASAAATAYCAWKGVGVVTHTMSMSSAYRSASSVVAVAPTPSASSAAACSITS